MSWFCRRCDAAFESEEDDPRCPQCLRKSNVVDPSAPMKAPASDPGWGAAGEPARAAKPFWPRFAVALPSCALLFLGLTATMSFGGIELTWPLRIYAALLGGVLLALPATLFRLPGMFAPFGPYPPAADDGA